MYFFRTAPLVLALARNEVSPRDQTYYLLASFLVLYLPSALGVSHLSGAYATWAHAIDVLFYISIVVIGTLAARAAAGEANRNFIMEFTCLLMPIALTTLAAAWSLHWLVIWSLGEELARWTWAPSAFNNSLRAVGTDLVGFLAFVTNAGAIAVIFARIVRQLRSVQAKK